MIFQDIGGAAFRDLDCDGGEAKNTGHTTVLRDRRAGIRYTRAGLSLRCDDYAADFPHLYPQSDFELQGAIAVFLLFSVAPSVFALSMLRKTRVTKEL